MKVRLPCVRCRKLCPYSFPDGVTKKRFRCPHCKRFYTVEFYELLNARSQTTVRKSTRGLMRFIDPGTPTNVEFELELNDPKAKTKKVVRFKTASSSRTMEDFNWCKMIALIYHKDTMIAVCNLSEDIWMTTFWGGLWLAKSYLPFVGD